MFLDDETVTGYDMPNNYEESLHTFDVRFCPYCGSINYISLWTNDINSLIFCVKCGGEI